MRSTRGLEFIPWSSGAQRPPFDGTIPLFSHIDLVAETGGTPIDRSGGGKDPAHQGGESDRWSSGGPAEERRKNHCVSSGEGNVGCGKALSTVGKAARLKRTVLAVEYCLVRSTGYYLQEAR